MEIRKDGKFFQILSNKCKNFDLCQSYIEKDDFESAYDVIARDIESYVSTLTMCLLNEYDGVFRVDILNHLDSVPYKFLYEAHDKELVVCLGENITEIKEKAFAYCEIKKLIIPNTIKKIGDMALSVNDCEIEYKGTKQDFINKFLGKNKCFSGIHHNQQIICTDDIITILKD